ncbi:MAG: glycogen synthase GlgA [Betaproteobacteria bacterium]
MKVLFVTPECAPLTKTGGLGDVSAALPAALRALGLDVRVLLPGYRSVLDGLSSLEPVETFRVLGQASTVLQHPGFFVLDCPALYRRDGGPYQDAAGRDWPDNPLRFGVLCHAAARLAATWRAEVVHCNDWPAGLTTIFLGKRPSVMTVHNLAFQGNFDASWARKLDVPADAYSVDGAEFHGQLSFLKAGLAYADAITTVSPTYAREVRTAELGCGMDGLLRRRAGVLAGILNGIDTAIWDPEKDPWIPQNYGPATLDRKCVNKEELRRRLGLAPRADLPLFGVVSRLTHQKGTDLIAAAAQELVALPAQLAVLGTGMREHEQGFSNLAHRFPGKISVKLGFDEPLAHLIEAGADFFLMPSRFEPCGLNQMYSQRYGTPPVARATGGLADTIAGGETGFLFGPPEPAALIDAARRAAALWRDGARRLAMQRAGMARDFGWAPSARRYAELYARLAVDRPAVVP